MVIPLFSCCFLVLGYWPGGAGLANRVMGYWYEGRTGYYLTYDHLPSRLTAEEVRDAQIYSCVLQYGTAKECSDIIGKFHLKSNQ